MANQTIGYTDMTEAQQIEIATPPPLKIIEARARAVSESESFLEAHRAEVINSEA